MIKVLVVDDEIRQRQSIIKHVGWQELRMNVIGEAEDADQALKQFETPDVLITDIRLMGSSGLELAADMRHRNPKLKVVMVTGYEQFEYAKTALDIGVEAFLVKPIDFARLEQVLLQIADGLEQERQLQAKLQGYAYKERASFLDDLLHGLLNEVEDHTLETQAMQYGLFADAAPRAVIVAVCSEDDAEWAKVMGDCAQMAFDGQVEAHVTTARQQMAFIVRAGTRDGWFGNALERFAESLMEAGVPGIAIGIGGDAASPSELANSYRNAVSAVNQRKLGVKGPLYNWEQLIGDRKRSHAQGIVQRAIDYMNVNYMNNLSLRSVADAVYLSPNYLGALLRSELGTSFTDQLVAIRVARAKELLLAPDLKLYEVAERVGYQNFGHFSNLFKRMTGFTPKDYRQFQSMPGNE
ncbi:putative DNA-binding response regulator [Paenibacillus agaridevorans]|uniref:Putative DNA-binding response regulator n=1 Tax=Paenibacillus agaridevorans TaxID=171404 RepID=A0A2R5ESY9_9BACL|nr:response regulator [Paenibacillus agaridevorans]GBG09802.1 putative DNA-binding response regulator [Paenibacillus agaridevorans]